MYKNLPTILMLVLTAALNSPVVAADRQIIAIQPLGKFDPQLIERVKQQLIENYRVDVVVRAEKELPKEAYYPSRARYRAEKLLKYLEKTDTTSTKVLGLTNVDISTTKGKFVDWGILGQGAVGGRPCVVSTFRMKGTVAKVSDSMFRNRFAKVVSHELGHTYGLDHCPRRGCLMEDAKGTVKTVDGETDFCPSCKEKLNLGLSPKP